MKVIARKIYIYM